MELTEQKLLKEHNEYLAQERREAIELNSERIAKFSSLCAAQDIDLMDKEFHHAMSIGVYAKKKSLLQKLLPNLPVDKEGLVPFKFIRDKSDLSAHMPGYIENKDFVIMVHSYFRRSMKPTNNYAPRFIELFWNVDNEVIDAYIALDNDRIKVGTEPHFYSESDTWFGAPFDKCIANIPDGISKIRPPLDLTEPYQRLLFNDAHTLDIKWHTKGNIKTFHSLEFKERHVTIELDGETYHPVRYIHAEFDLSTGAFRHFDGAVQHYLPSEYDQRVNMDFNFDYKSNKSIKAKSVKLFKFNGRLTVDFWVEFCSHFYAGNPLMFEYFTGGYPTYVNQALEKMRAKAT